MTRVYELLYTARTRQEEKTHIAEQWRGTGCNLLVAWLAISSPNDQTTRPGSFTPQLTKKP